MEMSRYKEAIADLDARGFGIHPGLERIEALMTLLDHPELSYPTIHLAGTNGKSTTSRMIGAILAAHGVKSGVYTSPHLQTVRERFTLSGPAEEGTAAQMITTGEFADAYAYLLPFVRLVENDRDEQVTYFEMTTALAFDWMADAAVGAGVYETGLGGRWDATNLVRSAVAVLTRIDVDHQHLLGSTPLENAEEKSGIIKEGSAVVSAVQQPDVRHLLQKTATEKGASIAFLENDFSVRADASAVGGRVATVEGLHAIYDDVVIPLFGAHQSRNAALAIAACESFLGKALDQESLALGMSTVTSPGRMEIVKRNPLVVLDGAHNPDGARALADALQDAFGERRTTMVVSISRDKDLNGILSALMPVADRVVVTRWSDERAAEPEQLAEIARKISPSKDITSIPFIDEAVSSAVSSSFDDELVLVTGSLYAVGEARTALVGSVD